MGPLVLLLAPTSAHRQYLLAKISIGMHGKNFRNQNSCSSGTIPPKFCRHEERVDVVYCLKPEVNRAEMAKFCPFGVAVAVLALAKW